MERPVALAPLAGWSDSVYRCLCKSYGATLLFTEMASADAIIRNHKKSWQIISFSEPERPIGIQLFGAEASTLAQAVHIVSEKRPDFIDINFGCPARKVVRRGAGAALLRDLAQLQRIAQTVVQATSLPLTAKLRSGWDSVVAVDACLMLQQAGFRMVTVHPRTQKMQFTGKADWNIIRQVKQAVTIPVLGNGDIKTAHDARDMMEQTGCDGVMIGRAARGNPWIFRQVEDVYSGRAVRFPDASERLAVCIAHLREAEAAGVMVNSAIAMRKHLAAYLKGLPCISEMRQKIFTVQDYRTIIQILESYQCTLIEQAGAER